MIKPLLEGKGGMNRPRYTAHALERMFERGISPSDCESVLETGDVIETYPDDQPFPSELRLGFVNDRPIHLVVSRDNETVHVITAYEPSRLRWEEDFRKRRSKSDD
jgi:hypothetical protein